jgi:hypothetical protein
MNQAAAAGAVELLDSLNTHEFGLLVVQGHGQHAHDSEFDVILYAVIEPTRVGCITPDGGRRELAATKAALSRASSAGRGCEVHCFVDLDLQETFGATPRNLARLCDWAVRIRGHFQLSVNIQDIVLAVVDVIMWSRTVHMIRALIM